MVFNAKWFWHKFRERRRIVAACGVSYQNKVVGKAGVPGRGDELDVGPELRGQYAPIPGLRCAVTTGTQPIPVQDLGYRSSVHENRARTQILAEAGTQPLKDQPILAGRHLRSVFDSP